MYTNILPSGTTTQLLTHRKKHGLEQRHHLYKKRRLEQKHDTRHYRDISPSSSTLNRGRLSTAAWGFGEGGIPSLIRLIALEGRVLPLKLVRSSGASLSFVAAATTVAASAAAAAAAAAPPTLLPRAPSELRTPRADID